MLRNCALPALLIQRGNGFALAFGNTPSIPTTLVKSCAGICPCCIGCSMLNTGLGYGSAVQVACRDWDNWHLSLHCLCGCSLPQCVFDFVLCGVWCVVWCVLLLDKISGIPMLDGYACKKWGLDPNWQLYYEKTPKLFPLLS